MLHNYRNKNRGMPAAWLSFEQGLSVVLSYSRSARVRIQTNAGDRTFKLYIHMIIARSLQGEGSWERGTVENANKLIRQYFPKHTDLKEISHAQIKVVQNALRQRPHETLGFRTPIESHFGEVLQKSLCSNVALDSRIYRSSIKYHCP